MPKKSQKSGSKKSPNLFGLLRPYSWSIAILLLFSVVANAVSLIVPKIISQAIDDYSSGRYDSRGIIIKFSLAALFIFIFTYLQNIMQTYTSERAARDLRADLVAKISRQSFQYIQKITPAKLLTNLTADVDSIKTFVSLGVVSIVSSLFIIIGASILLLLTDWKLALVVLLIIPMIGGTFFFVFRQVRVLFLQTREVLDWLNKIINESILGAALIRVLNSQSNEYQKFFTANTEAKNLGLKILNLFATMIPIISLVANLAILAILALGGHYVIGGEMSLGSFTAFINYVTILIFPILIIGFMSNLIAQASASYQRIQEVLSHKEKKKNGTLQKKLQGNIKLKNVTVVYSEKTVLNNVSFEISGGKKIAIIGPTAAGKTQLLYLLTGLVDPQAGEILFDQQPLENYDLGSLHRQIGFVFQDSIIFNLSIKENIAFSDQVSDASLQKAIDTAELSEYIDSLPEKLDTIISERGTSLSGGQKQRLMLARALAVNPKILLLDDFTARVDTATEKKILANISRNYPKLTLLSVTQKISTVEHYDKIILLMEGEILAQGTHPELLRTSVEYVQIYNSQKSTNYYELQS